MTSYTRADGSRNTRKPSKSAHQKEPALTRGGLVIKRRRPQWSISFCNAVAGLAGFAQEVHHG